MAIFVFSTWRQWNTNQETTLERIRPIRPIAEFNHGSLIKDIAFSSTNSELFASAGESNIVKIWNENNQDSPQITLKAQEDDDGSTNLNSIAFSPTDKWFTSKTFRTLEFWNFTSGRRINLIKIPAFEFDISPEGRYIATAFNGLKLWDITDLKNINGLVLLPPEIGWKPVTLEELIVPDTTSEPSTIYHMIHNKFHNATENQYYNSIDFSANGKWIAAGGHIYDKISGKNIGIIKVWDLRSKQLVKFIKRDREGAEDSEPTLYNNKIRAIDFSPDSRFLAVASNNGLTIWTLPDWQIYHEVVDQRISDIAFSPDGTMFAVADASGITLWSVDNITPIAFLKGKGLIANILVLAFSPDGTTLAGGSYNGVLSLWNITEVK